MHEAIRQTFALASRRATWFKNRIYVAIDTVRDNLFSNRAFPFSINASTVVSPSQCEPTRLLRGPPFFKRRPKKNCFVTEDGALGGEPKKFYF